MRQLDAALAHLCHRRNVAIVTDVHVTRLADDLYDVLGLLRRRSRRLVGAPFPDLALSGAQLDLVRVIRRNPGVAVARSSGASDRGCARGARRDRPSTSRRGPSPHRTGGCGTDRVARPRPVRAMTSAIEIRGPTYSFGKHHARGRLPALDRRDARGAHHREGGPAQCPINSSNRASPRLSPVPAQASRCSCRGSPRSASWSCGSSDTTGASC